MADQLPSLLLLPPPPHPANRAALKAAFEPPLKAAISRLKDEKADQHASILIVGLASPILRGTSLRQKSLSWPEAQSVVAGIYSIVSVICAQLSVPSHMYAGPGSVDVRVLLIDHDPSAPPPKDFKPAIEPNNTVVPDLATFASAYHPWKYIFHTSNEPGYQILSTYLKLAEPVQTLKQDQLIAVQGGLALNVAPTDRSQSSQQTEPHNIMCLGGTFDHLHPGHKLLLTAAVLLLNVPEKGTAGPCRFIIGVTGDELLKRKKYAELVQPWNVRAMSIMDFLSSILRLSKDGWNGAEQPKLDSGSGELVSRFRDDTIEIQCVEIQDAFGPTITAEDMDALVVSGETRSGGNAVNERRRELDWRQLEIFEVDVLDADDVVDGPTKTQDFASKISSTAIRQKKAESRI
ncbi:Uu.00g025900.m01.CDS01 [Anthostomella pinea]|uniref:Uu.00g025900.m01.CDS01 n=1 Tax=Anthostomella pinea TaxID=933095 RepID=A0AAI8V801_9PEZI|nr:Uu.00g025900.m01.CDS01 [Anthostomella pinea]